MEMVEEATSLKDKQELMCEMCAGGAGQAHSVPYITAKARPQGWEFQ